MSVDDFVNPFGDPIAPRPDASSTVPASENMVVTAGLGDYNPFEVGAGKLSGQMDTAVPVPPPYPVYDAQRLTTADLERRQRELEAKAEELDRREQEQNSRNVPSSVNNWPPLPSCCPCKPCFYQDIHLEIHSDHVKIVKYGYYFWLAYAALMALNLIVSFVFLVGSSNTSGGTQFGVSIIILVFCLPASYICWFRPLYKAFKKNSSINFFIYFFVFGAQIVVLGIQTLGISGSGSCGWLMAFSVVKTEPGIAAATVVIAVLFTLLTAGGVFLLLRVHNIYRNTGASFMKAREELSMGIATDPTVRSATVGAGLFAARQAAGGP